MERLSSVLDAWAILALLRDEPAAVRVEDAIRSGSVASWINLGEVIYNEADRVGLDRAQSAVARLTDLVRCEEPDADLIRSAAVVKATHRVSYADGFAVATAERHRLPLLTGDREILAIERGNLELIDLRATA
jgi:PIN domain nuclease of toxin-antitoxin system